MKIRFPALAVASGLCAASLASPASATLFFYIDVTAGGVSQSYFCAATDPCNTSGSLSRITLPTQLLNGVVLRGEDDTSRGTPANPGLNLLSSSVGRVTNTNTSFATVDVVISDTSFTAPATKANLAGAGTFQLSVGSNFKLNWFADAANTQGAVGGATPGTEIGTYTAPISTPIVLGVGYTSPDIPVSFTAPFSLTEQTIYTLAPGGELITRGQTAVLTGVPEPTTWAMLLLGFVGIGLVGRRKQSRSAIPAV